MFKSAFVATAFLIAASVPALAQSATVNSYTPAQERAAIADLRRAGFSPGPFWVQDGNFFFNTTKGGEVYGVTVTSAGKVYAGGLTS